MPCLTPLQPLARGGIFVSVRELAAMSSNICSSAWLLAISFTMKGNTITSNITITTITVSLVTNITNYRYCIESLEVLETPAFLDILHFREPIHILNTRTLINIFEMPTLPSIISIPLTHQRHRHPRTLQSHRTPMGPHKRLRHFKPAFE